MKKIIRIIALLLLIVSTILLSVSCSLQKKYEQAASDYLKNKYPQRKFEMLSYRKNPDDSSGRYEVEVRCLTDDIEFEMYIYSSILITDSYNIERANERMYVLLDSILTDSLVKDKVDNIEWLRKYNEESTDGSFVEYDYPEDITLKDLKSIYRIFINKELSIEEIAKVICNISRSFELNEKSLESVGFSFVLNDVEYVLNVSTEFASYKTEEEVVNFINTAIENTSNTKNFYWETTQAIPLVVK